MTAEEQRNGQVGDVLDRLVAGVMEGVKGEYHDKPSPHFVWDEDTWRHLVEVSGAKASEAVAGSIGQSYGLPAYIDQCPWNCEVERV